MTLSVQELNGSLDIPVIQGRERSVLDTGELLSVQSGQKKETTKPTRVETTDNNIKETKN